MSTFVTKHPSAWSRGMCAGAHGRVRAERALEEVRARRDRERERVPRRMTLTFNPIFSALETTIFETMSRLARENEAVNLGQGFPDDPGPEDVRRKAAEAAVSGWNQYPPML